MSELESDHETKISSKLSTRFMYDRLVHFSKMRWVQFTWIIVICIFLLCAVIQNIEAIKLIGLSGLRTLSLALLASIIRKLCGGIRWGILVRLLGRGKDLSFRKSLKIYFISCLSMYLPGTYWFIPGRIVMNAKHGINSLHTGVSIVLEQFLIVISGALMAIFSFQIAVDALHIPIPAPMLLVILIIAGIILTHPVTINRVTRLFATILKIEDFSASIKFTTNLLLLSGSVIVWLVSGLSLLLLVKAFVPSIAYTQIGSYTSVFAATFLVGYFTPFAPSGLGVREGALGIALVMLGIPADLVVLIAALSRLLLVAEDLFWGAVSLVAL